MALGGLSPLIIFTFYKPNFSVSDIFTAKIPLVPIPIYLDEKLTGIQVDDYNRTISIDMLREGVSMYEKMSGDVVQLKFRASKNNIFLTVISALFDRIISIIDTAKFKNLTSGRDYSLSLFYDNILIIDASLEQFQTTLIEGTDLREITVQLAKRPPAALPSGTTIIKNIGTAAGKLAGV